MKYKLTKAEQETVINFDNELDTASIYTHDSRLIKKLRELRKQYPEQFILEHREHGSVTYTIPKRCVGIRPPYSEKRREQQRQEAKENGLVIVYGASDDLMEFDGAIYDEGGCFDGGRVYFDRDGVD